MDELKLGVFKFTTIHLPDNVFNTFFYLNQTDVQQKSNLLPLLAEYGPEFDKKYYTSLGVFIAAVPKGCVGASPVLAERLCLKANDEVFINTRGWKSLKKVSVRAKTAFDYDILVNVHSLMEVVMMDQVRVVAPRQTLPLKVGNIVIDLIIECLYPSGEFGCLEKYTEVEILDPSSEYVNDRNLLSSQVIQTAPLSDIIWKLYQWGLRIWKPASIEHKEVPIKTLPSKEDILAAFRNRRSKHVEYRVVIDKNALTSVDVVFTNIGFAKQPKPCRITRVYEQTEIFENTSKVKEKDKSVMYSLVSSRLTSDNKVPEVYLSKKLLSQLNVTVGSRVTITEVPELPEKTLVEKSEEVKNEEGDIFLWPAIDAIYNEVVHTAECFFDNVSNNALITGPEGCGKSYLLKKLSRYFSDNNIYCSKVDCTQFRGKTIERLCKILAEKFSECAYRDPSVLLLDDLDSLLNLLDGDEEDLGLKGAYCKRIAALITELHDSFVTKSKISIVATAASVASIGALATSRGPRLFSLVVKVPEMTPTERKLMLERLGVPAGAVEVEKTHGFRIQDLADLVSRAKLRALVADRDVCSADVLNALQDTTPMALQGVALQADVPYRWTDVGGLAEVKNTMEEIFRWPSQYPEVFATCPLALQTGALLYGAPGCGKTLVAGALANECGMNFISVKGPELLSKYVGASEAAVRSLFDRAQQARPCLLFFDELDSLAPRRGADSTGVTDRVVNQMLTELDGVEGRQGVWVLGASSRPDLIDPALLRPGRLDRAVFCPLPSQEERLEILKTMKGVNFGEGVSLADLAAKTERFTGADLQALLYNAQINAIKECSNPNDDDDPPIDASHLASALLSTKPSMSKADLLKYHKIFERFQVRKNFRETTTTDLPQKVTLA